MKMQIEFLLLNMYTMYNMLLIASNLYIQLKRTKQDLSLRCTQKLNNFSLHTIFCRIYLHINGYLMQRESFSMFLHIAKTFLNLLHMRKYRLRSQEKFLQIVSAHLIHKIIMLSYILITISNWIYVQVDKNIIKSNM